MLQSFYRIFFWISPEILSNNSWNPLRVSLEIFPGIVLNFLPGIHSNIRHGFSTPFFQRFLRSSSSKFSGLPPEIHPEFLEVFLQSSCGNSSELIRTFFQEFLHIQLILQSSAKTSLQSNSVATDIPPRILLEFLHNCFNFSAGILSEFLQKLFRNYSWHSFVSLEIPPGIHSTFLPETSLELHREFLQISFLTEIPMECLQQFFWIPSSKSFEVPLEIHWELRQSFSINYSGVSLAIALDLIQQFPGSSIGAPPGIP